MSEERRIEQIPIQNIIPNIYQPRIKFDDKSISDLSKSIKDHGIIQPLIVRKIGNSYEIIDGERRYKAAKKIGINTIPSIVLDIDDKEAAELILTENMQKQLLTPIEEANAYQQIMLLNKYEIDELASKLGKEKTIIEQKLKLLTLAPEIQEALLNNKIAEGHARALTKIKDREKQINLYNKVLNERLPVKALEEIINENEFISTKTTKNEEIIKNIQKEENKISLNELNKKDFLKKENKMEEQKMDSNQLNFNQYNNLLKEQEKPIMETTMQPEPILGNTINTPKPNEFFPSLEEQPLNMDVPVSPSMPQPEVPAMNMMEQPVAAPMMEAPQMPEMGTPMGMPQFEMAPSMPQPEVPAMNMMEQPVMTNVMPAVNMIRNLIPLLENSGYNITIEEADTPNDYQIILKVQK